MAMSELGAYLLRHREEKGLSLEELEQRTRIRLKYLEAIEAGEWDELPPGVYTRGLLRNYARALGLSSARVLRMYVKERPSEARLPEPQLISQPLVQQPRFSAELFLALALLAVAIGLFAWMVGTQLMPVLNEARLPGTGLTIASAATETRATRSTPTLTATKTPVRAIRGTAVPLATSTPRPTPTPRAGLEINVEATSDAWVMIYTDGQEAFTGFLHEGDSRRWNANQRVRLRTGNAGGTRVTLNGARVGVLGAPGAVEEREWRLLPNGDIEQSS